VKAILLLLSGLCAAVVVFLGGLLVSAHVIAEPAPHQFAHLDTPDLWTLQPVKIDQSKQAYERVPGPVLVADVPGSDAPKSLAIRKSLAFGPNAADPALTSSTDKAASDVPSVANAVKTVSVDTAQADWCFARYRSYRVEDNSYQPYAGGPRRQCEAPGMATSTQASSVAQVEAQPVSASGNEGVTTQNAAISSDRDQDASVQMSAMNSADMSATHADISDTHAEWCMARYRSYRAGDNSYQPFDGGPRKSCQSPFG
jgi:hypothetical protein